MNYSVIVGLFTWMCLQYTTFHAHAISTQRQTEESKCQNMSKENMGNLSPVLRAAFIRFYNINTTTGEMNNDFKINQNTEEKLNGLVINAENTGLRLLSSLTGFNADTYFLKGSYATKNTGTTHLAFTQVYCNGTTNDSPIKINIDRNGRLISLGSSAMAYPQNAQYRDDLIGTSPVYYDSKSEETAIFEYYDIPSDMNSSIGEGFDKARNVRSQNKRDIPFSTPVDTNDEKLVSTDRLKESQRYVQRKKYGTSSDQYFTKPNVKREALNSSDSNRKRALKKQPLKLALQKLENQEDRYSWYHRFNRENVNCPTGNNVEVRLATKINYDEVSEWLACSADYSFDNNTVLAGDSQKIGKSTISTYSNREVAQAIFETINMMHDLFYIYGFDETAGNLQRRNFGYDGGQADELIVYFSTNLISSSPEQIPETDGVSPVIIFPAFETITGEVVPSGLDETVVIHEYTHGLVDRIVYSHSNSSAKNFFQHLALSEGWCDFIALLVQVLPEHNRNHEYSIGEFMKGQNLRAYPYTTNGNINPLKYSDLGNMNDDVAHSEGAVWASILLDMLWDLNDQYGISPNLLTFDLTKGNSLALQLVIDGMKLITSSAPTFIEARDAILSAEAILTNGKNNCIIWKAFAKRGLGLGTEESSNNRFKDGFYVPQSCMAEKNIPI